MIEQEWVEEPRRLTEIVDAIDELCTKIWYNRHQVRREQIEAGKIKIVEKETFPVKNHFGGTSSIDGWKDLKGYMRHVKSSPLEDVGVAAMTAIRTYFD